MIQWNEFETKVAYCIHIVVECSSAWEMVSV